MARWIWGSTVDNDGKRVIKDEKTGNPVAWVCPIATGGSKKDAWDRPDPKRDAIGEQIMEAHNRNFLAVNGRT